VNDCHNCDTESLDIRRHYLRRLNYLIVTAVFVNLNGLASCGRTFNQISINLLLLK
jgi:hypothetical protein